MVHVPFWISNLNSYILFKRDLSVLLIIVSKIDSRAFAVDTVELLQFPTRLVKVSLNSVDQDIGSVSPAAEWLSSEYLNDIRIVLLNHNSRHYSGIDVSSP